MARVIICDYLKTKLGKDEPTYKVTVECNGENLEFEVGSEGRQLLLKQLEGDDEPRQTAPLASRLPPAAPQQAPSEPVKDAIGREVDVTEEVQDNLPQPVMAEDEGLPPIPENTRLPLRRPKPTVAQRIVDESTIREEGTLDTLTVGNKRQREARKRLEELENVQNDKIRRKAGSGVNVGFDNNYDGRR